MVTDSSEYLLRIQNLITEFDTDEGRVRAVDDISFSIQSGETMGLVGESGCGKSVTAHSIMQLLPQPMGQIVGGQILFNSRDLSRLPHKDMEKIRGGSISMVFQEPMTALNPVHTIGKQLAEVVLLHMPVSNQQALNLSIEILERVGIPSPDVRMGEYPHQLSGGMRQRVGIAMALVCNPSLLIADEPTTALDVTIQAQILELIKELQQDLGMSVMLITHDLGVIAETCDRVVVMYAGKIVEKGTVFDVFDNPSHPYTKGLLESIPRLQDENKGKLNTIDGMVPGLMDLPAGCRFENRCPYKQNECDTASPPAEQITPEHEVNCYHWRDLIASTTTTTNVT
jgi:peptide/nickel transport system ATP-binding protein